MLLYFDDSCEGRNLKLESLVKAVQFSKRLRGLWSIVDVIGFESSKYSDNQNF